MAERVDLLVIGGGMAGMTAAAQAARAGRSVLVVDIAPEPGGSARFAGVAWTAPSRAVIDEVAPLGDAQLRHALVDDFQLGLDWMRSVGTEFGDEMPVLGYGRGHRFDTNQYIDTCARIVHEAGGQVWTEIEVTALRQDVSSQDGDGVRVVGAEVRRGGETLVIDASWVLLATGGLQGDPDLLAAHIHPSAPQMQLRGNPHSAGGGYRLATSVGAASVGDNPGFYGHLIPSQVPFAGPEDFIPLSLYYSEHALLFNLDGERFTDESLGDHLTTMALLEQRESRGLLIADARVHRDWVLGAYVKGAANIDRFALASKRGGRVGVAEELEELAYLPEDWGYPGEAIAQGIADHNRRLSEGQTISPDRRRDRLPLREGPWYVVECVPAITFAFHGIRIDAEARVLTPSGRPIPGLLAAGSDTGGLYNRAYAGGLAAALVFAGRAVRTLERGSAI